MALTQVPKALTTGVAASGANSDITSITGLTTPLAHTKGGTGLAALGTANQVLAVNSGASALEFQDVAAGYNRND